MDWFNGLLAYSMWEKFASLHGLFATVSLIFFGASLALAPVFDKTKQFFVWFRNSVTILFALLVLATINGLLIYQPYRAKVPDSPRSVILASNSPWLHNTIFEHKEFLAFAPWLLIGFVVFVVWYLGTKLIGPRYNELNRVIFWSILLALIITLVVATEGVLVTKFAPIK